MAQTKEFIDTLNNISKLTDPQELVLLNQLVVERIKQIGKQKARELAHGDKVKFQSKNRGIIYGTVERVLQKKIEMKSIAGGKWTVSAAMVQPWDGVDPMKDVKF